MRGDEPHPGDDLGGEVVHPDPLGGGRRAVVVLVEQRSRWSSHRVSPSSWSMRARLVSPTSSATATAEASMMIVPSSWRMSCRSRLRHSCRPPRSDAPVRSRCS
ncbi:hypothetical protein ACFQY7_31675 [Actinomadura luteofluorescens]|uniref:hypothetical protein n=1 Tax=Actinomadura luteofluorescens TaxID=46163 RepID=UPI00362C82FE